MILEKVSCNFCNSQNHYQLFQLTDLLMGDFSETFSYVRCHDCGLIFQNPRIRIEDILKYYPENYDSYQEVNRNDSTLLGKILRYGLRKRKNFVYEYCKSGRLLDVGCSTGDFLDEISDNGKNHQWELFGIEISEYAANIARKKKRLNIFNSTLEEANFPDEYFDVITLWDVLEHLYDPYSSLLEINRILKHGGILVIRVPNYDSLDRLIFKSSWAGWDAPRHLYVFNKKILRAYLEKTGFSIASLKTNIGSYTTFLLSLRFFLTKKKKFGTVQSNLLSTLYSPFFRITTAPLFYVISMSGLGSLMVITSIKN
ncbi:MAG: class I SAM-dependent methyltransferase [Bacteroidota bacterium]